MPVLGKDKEEHYQFNTISFEFSQICSYKLWPELELLQNRQHIGHHWGPETDLPANLGVIYRWAHILVNLGADFWLGGLGDWVTPLKLSVDTIWVAVLFYILIFFSSNFLFTVSILFRRTSHPLHNVIFKNFILCFLVLKR